jgi:hypothetical protein
MLQAKLNAATKRLVRFAQMVGIRKNIEVRIAKKI